MNAELLVDSGANTELKLPACKVLQLGLTPRGRPVRARGSTNDICRVQVFSPVLVRATFIRDGLEETVEADLTVQCNKQEYDDMLDGQSRLNGNYQGGEGFTTPPAQSVTASTVIAIGNEPIVVRPSPTQHRPVGAPLQQAVLGIDGLKKLRLHLNCELQQLEIEEDEVLDDG